MKIYRLTAFIITLIFIAATLTGCTTFDNFKEAFIEKPQDSKATIQIGIYEPMSGADKKNAEDEIKGIKLAYEQYPTVNGKLVELVDADNASDIYAAETAIKELLLKEPTVILGSYGSVYSLVAGDYIRDAKVPTIAITNSNPLVTKNNSYYFRVCYVDSNQGDILAKYVLEEKNEKTAGVLLPKDDDAAMAMATAFTDRIKAETNNEDAVTVYEEYVPGGDDFSEQLNIVKESGVKNVLLPGEINDSVKIIKQAQEMGLDTVFLGDSDWTTDEFTSLYGNGTTINNAEFISFFGKEVSENKEAEKFLKAYSQKYGKESKPSDAVALGYDAYVIAINAIDKASDDAEAEEVREVLAGQAKFQGASGMITFNGMGDPIKTAYISVWENGEINTVATINPTL
ncbi:MAG: ABC transporter substrate-binding protein [Bacillota bacterium]|nr:ABC transporter substrate-binding protein [Bacillota bacterium]